MSSLSLSKNVARRPFGYLYPFKSLFEKAHIDFEQMIEIIQLKSRVLGRTEQEQLEKARARKRKFKMTAQTTLKKTNEDSSFFSTAKAISYLITSLFIMFYGFLFTDPRTTLSIIFTVGFVMQFLGMITSFPFLILDTKDFTVLATKPIDKRTIAAAKTTLATLYMIFSSGAIYAFTFIPFIYKGHLEILPFMLLSVVLSNLVCVGLAYLLYGMVLKFYDGEKLKDLIAMFQIALTIFIMVGYQLIAQLQNIVDVASGVTFSWWHLLIPPLWFSNLSATLLNTQTLVPGLLCGALIFLFLLIHFTLTGKLLEENLGKMLSDGEAHRNSYHRKVALLEKLGRIIYKDSQDLAFFMLGYSISTNDRKMKQTIYPMYVSMLILPAIMLFNAWREHEENLFQVFSENSWLIFFLYLSGVTIGSVVLYVKRSENAKGAWVYEVLPIESKRRAYKAVAANMILRYVALPMAIFVILMLFLVGFSGLWGLLCIFTFTLLTTFATLKTEQITWPFSYDLNYSEAKKGILVLLNLLALGLYVGLHAICQYLLAPFGVPLLWVFTCIATYFLWKKI